jgi:hypothetical protein
MSGVSRTSSVSGTVGPRKEHCLADFLYRTEYYSSWEQPIGMSARVHTWVAQGNGGAGNAPTSGSRSNGFPALAPERNHGIALCAYRIRANQRLVVLSLFWFSFRFVWPQTALPSSAPTTCM